MRKPVCFIAFMFLAITFLGVAHAANQGVVVTVNDIPITTFDIDQRLRLLKILGDRQGVEGGRKKALRMMIDEIVKISEAKKYKANPSEKEIDAQLGQMAKGMNTDAAGLKVKLQKQDISIASLKQYLEAQIAFNRILSGKYQVKIKVEPAEVDKKIAEIKQGMDKKLNAIMNDPRMKPVEVYTIVEIDLPVEIADDAMLLQARAVEAGQFIKNFKGCGSAREAASGIFNVKIGKKIDAVADKIPKQLRQALDEAGPGKAMGPMRGPKGIQVIGFCGRRVVKPEPPKVTLPTRQQAEIVVSNEKYAAVEGKYLAIMRKSALIEYKDPSYAPQ
jgi:peptidyl-prolyl cis-trans isomerase SurA